jgi:hypothetical protein
MYDLEFIGFKKTNFVDERDGFLAITFTKESETANLFSEMCRIRNISYLEFSRLTVNYKVM